MSDTLTPQDAIIYLMVTTAAADGEFDDAELRTIGRVVRSFPLFTDADESQLVRTAEDCGKLMSSEDGLQKVMAVAKSSIPSHLGETAYAAVIDVVTADEALDPAELRILEMVRDTLSISDEGASALERAARARHMTTEPVD
ncbi:MAG: tellurite resistance TerB family protein [Pseudomonadota bacterium]